MMEETFSASVSQVCVTVQTISESPPVYENNEVFGVTVSVVDPDANPRVTIGAISTTTVRIEDGQSEYACKSFYMGDLQPLSAGAGVSMSEASITHNEGDGDVTVCARLNSPAGGIEKEIFIQLTLDDGSPSMEFHVVAL